MTTKTFRGLIATQTVDIVSLHSNNGSIGYRIKKLELMPEAPGTTTYELIVKIFTTPQTVTSSAIDFSDQTLIASAYLEGSAGTTPGDLLSVVFDNITFNQDIYITCFNENGAGGANYQLELEQFPLDLNENTVATLKDIRNLS